MEFKELKKNEKNGLKKNKLSLFIDSCAWNILFENNVSLAEELPLGLFDLAMTKEISAFEIKSIPSSKQELINYIEEQVNTSNIREDSYFGFSSYHDPPSYKSRNGGFGEGRFISYEEAEVLQRYEVVKDNLRIKTQLFKNEADASLAIRSLTGHIVITVEKPDKPGPLKNALKEGGLIINIGDYSRSQTSFGRYILLKIEQILKN